METQMLPRSLLTGLRSVLLITSGVTAIAFMLTAGAAGKKDEYEPMTNARLEQLIRRLDEKAQGRPGFWQLTVEKRELLVITDEQADRMRIFTEVAKADDLDQEMMQRLLRANFDSALDARYSIARGRVWSVFLHPLRSLHDADFLSGLGQVVNLASTYGTTYSSGLLIFRGGDSGALRQRELIERLQKKGLEI